MSAEFNIQQRTAINLIQNDFRFIYTILRNKDQLQSNYNVMSMPFLGTIIDGTEEWIQAFNASTKEKLEVPIFSSDEQKYYEEMRASIKFIDDSYANIRQKLSNIYNDSEIYFASLCKPIARKMKLYDIFGADIVGSHFCGNTILCNYYVPQYKFGIEKGEELQKYSEIGGKYIVLFDAKKEYCVDKNMNFTFKDYGGFVKSPFGNRFSDKFVLFSIVCQINFIMICIEKYIKEECTTKLRFEYLQYYYLTNVLGEINETLNTDFTIDQQWKSDLFRNSMAHYKIGVALKPSEIKYDDLMFGLTQKYFRQDYLSLKKKILTNLQSVSDQIEEYLRI